MTNEQIIDQIERLYESTLDLRGKVNGDYDKGYFDAIHDVNLFISAARSTMVAAFQLELGSLGVSTEDE